MRGLAEGADNIRSSSQRDKLRAYGAANPQDLQLGAQSASQDEANARARMMNPGQLAGSIIQAWPQKRPPNAFAGASATGTGSSSFWNGYWPAVG